MFHAIVKNEYGNSLFVRDYLENTGPAKNTRTETSVSCMHVELYTLPRTHEYNVIFMKNTSCLSPETKDTRESSMHVSTRTRAIAAANTYYVHGSVKKLIF